MSQMRLISAIGTSLIVFSALSYTTYEGDSLKILAPSCTGFGKKVEPKTFQLSSFTYLKAGRTFQHHFVLICRNGLCLKVFINRPHPPYFWEEQAGNRIFSSGTGFRKRVGLKLFSTRSTQFWEDDQIFHHFPY